MRAESVQVLVISTPDAHSGLRKTVWTQSDVHKHRYLLPLLLLLLLLHTLLYLTQQAGRVGGESMEAVLLRQLLQPSSQLPVGYLDLLELQLVLSQLDTREELTLEKNSFKRDLVIKFPALHFYNLFNPILGF